MPSSGASSRVSDDSQLTDKDFMAKVTIKLDRIDVVENLNTEKNPNKKLDPLEYNKKSRSEVVISPFERNTDM